MMKHTIRILLALSFTTFTAVIAQANNKMYVRGLLGHDSTSKHSYVLKDATAVTNRYETKSAKGTAYSGAIGYYVNDYFATELEVSGHNSIKANITDSEIGDSLSSKVLAGFVNGQAAYKNPTILTPYAMAGLGIAKIDGSTNVTAINFAKTGIAYQGGIGAQIAATEVVALDLNVRYVGYFNDTLNSKSGAPSGKTASMTKNADKILSAGVVVKF